MAADLDQFQQLLNTLLSTDNDARTQAEVRIFLLIFIYIFYIYYIYLAKNINTRKRKSFLPEHVANVLSEYACGYRSLTDPTESSFLYAILLRTIFLRDANKINSTVAPIGHYDEY